MTVGFSVVVTSSIKQSLVYNRLYEKKVKLPNDHMRVKAPRFSLKKLLEEV